MTTFDEAKNCWILTIPHRTFYTVLEVATILMKPTSTIYSWIRRAKLTSYKIEELTVIKHEDLIHFIGYRERLRRREFHVHSGD